MIQAAKWKRWVSAAVEGHPIDLGSLVGLRSLSPASMWNNSPLWVLGHYFTYFWRVQGEATYKPQALKGDFKALPLFSGLGFRMAQGNYRV